MNNVEPGDFPAALADHDHRKDIAKVSSIYGQIAQRYEACLRALLAPHESGSAVDDEDTLKAKGSKSQEKCNGTGEEERKNPRKSRVVMQKAVQSELCEIE